MAPVSASALEILACPVCLHPLRMQAFGEPEAVVCTGCGRAYPIMDGIPVLIPERAIVREAS